MEITFDHIKTKDTYKHTLVIVNVLSQVQQCVIALLLAVNYFQNIEACRNFSFKMTQNAVKIFI